MTGGVRREPSRLRKAGRSMTVHRLVGFAIVLVFAGAGSAQPADKILDQHYSRARQALEAKDYETAAGEWKAIVDLRPALPEARANLGLMYHQQRKYDRAIEQFREGLRLNPKLLSASVFLGIDYYLTSRADLAIPQLRRASALDPQQVLPRKWLAMSLFETGDFAPAISELKQCQRLDPGDRELTFHLGRAYMKLALSAFQSLRMYGSETPWFFLLRGDQFSFQGEVKKALEEYEHARRLAPALPGLHYNIAQSLETMRQPQDAVLAYTQELRNAPAHVRAAVALLGLLRRAGLDAEARDVFQLTQQLHKGNPAALQALAETHRAPAIGQPETVLPQETTQRIREFVQSYTATVQSSQRHDRSWIEKARDSILGDNPRDALRIAEAASSTVGSNEVSYWKARAYLDLDQPGQALSHLVTLHHREPANPRFAYYLHQCAEKLSLRELESFARLEPGSPLTYQLRAELHAARGEDAEALDQYQKALQLKPGATQLHLAIGDLYVAQKEYEKALAEYQAELRNDPYSVPALTRCGEVQASLEKPVEAEKVLHQAIGMSATSARAHKALGRLYFSEGRFIEAVKHLQSALEYGDPDDETVHYQLARAFSQIGNRRKAEEHLAAVRKLHERRNEITRERLESSLERQSSKPVPASPRDQ
jgi:tetratricopeptide (TPR) repeat protein